MPAETHDSELQDKCQQLRVLAQDLESMLAWMPNVDPADEPLLADTLRTVTALQGLLSQCVRPKSLSSQIPQALRPNSSLLKEPKSNGHSRVLSDGDVSDHDFVDVQVTPPQPQDDPSAPIPTSSPMIKTPTMPRSAHDVVWCANRGASPIPQAMVLQLKPKRHTDEWEGLDELQDDDVHADVYRSVMQLFAEQKALVKTIKNDSVDSFMEKLKDCVADNSTFRTSTTLLPPNGQHMRVFGSERQYSAGFIWDRTPMDLSHTWAWPSGYYAKTEFNIDSGTGRLKNGREEALVTIDQLLDANNSFDGVHAFNEVYADVGLDTLVAVFSRSTRYDHLLHTLGLQTAVWSIIGRWIPSFVIDPVRGVQPFCRRHQYLMLSSFLAEVNPSVDAILAKPFLPIDVIRKYSVDKFNKITGDQVMQFHGAYGCTENCLDFIFSNPNIEELMDWVYLGLSYAAHANNVVAAHDITTRAGPVAIKHPETLSMEQIGPIVQNTTSEQVLPQIGAFVVFASICSGAMLKRVREALDTLKQWLEQSDSLSFRMASWRSMKNHPDSKMMPFVGNQAITNRTKFYNALKRLEERNGLTYYLIELSVIVSGLHHPCLRLDLLQYILGLDTRYTAACLRETIDVALRCAIASN